jgi:hypothetical protein
MSRYAAALGGALLAIAISHPAGALPKTSSSGRCVCACFVTNNVVSFNSYDDKGLGCGAFNGQTCNSEDPNTGIIQQGKTDSCSPDTTSTSLRLPSSVLRARGLQQKLGQ